MLNLILIREAKDWAEELSITIAVDTHTQMKNLGMGFQRDLWKTLLFILVIKCNLNFMKENNLQEFCIFNELPASIPSLHIPGLVS